MKHSMSSCMSAGHQGATPDGVLLRIFTHIIQCISFEVALSEKVSQFDMG
jgi:hypothetical protein